jgi:DNA-binding response OmpR family regulator
VLFPASPFPEVPSHEGPSGSAFAWPAPLIYHPGFTLDARVRLLLAGPRNAWTSLAARLSAEGVHVHRAETLAEVAAQLETYDIRGALVVPELWGPGRFGVPVILHPVPFHLEARLQALDGGAADALAADTSDREILARLTAVLRRTGAPS